MASSAAPLSADDLLRAHIPGKRTAPDLVVEVLSPDDRPGEVLAKVGDWLSAGCRLVWVVDPERRVDLDGEDVLPGFGCALATIL